MKKRDYYILFLLIVLVAFAAYYRKEYRTNAEAQENRYNDTNPIHETGFVPTSLSK